MFLSLKICLICPPIPGGGPTKRGGGKNVLAMMIFKGGTTRFVSSFYTVAVLKGGQKRFQHKKGERENFYPVFGGGGCQKELYPLFSHF